jgi:hypothetical protein
LIRGKECSIPLWRGGAIFLSIYVEYNLSVVV